ncbi:MAG: hypothetical protein R2815_09945 [Flavobacteriales bacterium]
MKLDVHDNAREGLQFLAVGILVILVARGALFVLDQYAVGTRDAIPEIAAFRNGYPLLPDHTVVIGGSELVPRTGVAGLFTLTSGLLGALLLAPFGLPGARSATRAGVLGARIGLLIGAGWSLFAVLRIPPHSASISSSGITITDHRSFLGEIPWPGTGTTRTVAWDGILGIEAVTADHGGQSPLEEVRVRTDDGVIPIARQVTIPNTSVRRAYHGDAARLVTFLETMRAL